MILSYLGDGSSSRSHSLQLEHKAGVQDDQMRVSKQHFRVLRAESQQEKSMQ